MSTLRIYLIPIAILSYAVVALNAFSVDNFSIKSSFSRVQSCRVPQLCMCDKDESSSSSSSEGGVFMKSVLNKEIVYDEKSGRFFESKYTEEDCLPDEEYCFLDKSTGESIRLTVEEKERIFMDALQVCINFCLSFLGKMLFASRSNIFRIDVLDPASSLS
jgi:hypothetical protein